MFDGPRWRDAETVRATELTKRERVMRAGRFQETDRVPIYYILENDDVIEHYAGQPLAVENGAWVNGLAIGRVLDMTRMPGGPQAPGEVMGENGIRVRQERWTSWIVERPFDDTPSLVEWIKRDIRRTKSLVYDRVYAEQMHQSIRDHLANFAAGDPTGRGDPTVLILESGVGLTEMYHWVGMQRFAYLMVDVPDLVEEWLEARLQAELRRVAMIADPDLIPIALTYDDIAYKNAPLFSPQWLRAHWMPRLKRLVEAWHHRDTLWGRYFTWPTVPVPLLGRGRARPRGAQCLKFSRSGLLWFCQGTGRKPLPCRLCSQWMGVARLFQRAAKPSFSPSPHVPGQCATASQKQCRRQPLVTACLAASSGTGG